MDDNNKIKSIGHAKNITRIKIVQKTTYRSSNHLKTLNIDHDSSQNQNLFIILQQNTKFTYCYVNFHKCYSQLCYQFHYCYTSCYQFRNNVIRVIGALS